MNESDNHCKALATLERASQQDLADEFVQGGIIATYIPEFIRVKDAVSSRYELSFGKDPGSE